MKTNIQNLFIGLVWLALPAVVQAQFSYTTNNGAITITGYNTAAGLTAAIPAATNGYPVTSIGDGAFQYSGITNVTIPNSVTNIGENAFNFCTSLTGVTFPDSVTSIGNGAFYSCTSLTSVTLPASVTSIGTIAFGRCFSLTNITVSAANPAYSSLNGVFFDKAQATLLQFPGALGGSYPIPNSVNSIGVWAFAGCSRLTSVTIPNSVTSIGYNAFDSCTDLTSITIPKSVNSIGDTAFIDSTSLRSAYFQGNAPPDDGTVFALDPATVYYLPGTTGWGATFGGQPTAP
jgi:hypothetical protein